MADFDNDEETGLLSDQWSKPASRKRPLSTELIEESRPRGLVARVTEAWRRPIGRDTYAPRFLKRRIVASDEEEALLEQLRRLAAVPFDGDDALHEHSLRRFFGAIKGPAEARGLPASIKDRRWKDLGFQANDPRTDFRGGGYLALQNMCFLAEAYPDHTLRMIREAQGGKGNVEYLFAAACVNISAMLVLLLGLNMRTGVPPVRDMPVPANAMARKNFARILHHAMSQSERRSASAEVFSEFFATSSIKMHIEWKALCKRKPGATLLDFGEALGATAMAMECLLVTLGQPLREPWQVVFSSMEKIDPNHWKTRLSTMMLRLQSSVVEKLCRLAEVIVELLRPFIEYAASIRHKRRGRSFDPEL